MASHAAFELDFYRQTAVVFSHNLDPKRTWGTSATIGLAIDVVISQTP